MISPPVDRTLNTLWLGGDLGALERACLRSVLRQGHPLNLYCYEEPGGAPEGVTIADAATILPQTRVLQHEWGASYALFADLFRYELQRLGKGPWIDTDLYFVQPLDCSRPYIFGDQSEGLVNGAVLKLPHDSPILPPLLRVFAEKEVPFWLKPKDRRAALWRRLVTGRTQLARMPWGAAGPNALTALIKRHDLTDWVLPTDVFYPRFYKQAGWILDPSIKLEDVVTPRTVAVHLWNQLIKDYKDEPAPAGSFLARLQAEGAR